MKLNSFLLVTALSIHCSYILAAQTNLEWDDLVESARKCEEIACLDALLQKVAENQECWSELVEASKFGSLGKKQIVKATVNECNFYLRYAFWKLTGVLLSIPTEDGENANLPSFSIDKERNITTIGSIAISHDGLDFREKEHICLLFPYFWVKRWLILDGDLKDHESRVYAQYIIAPNDLEFLKSSLIKALEDPDHIMNKLRIEGGGWDSDFLDVLFRGIIKHDAVNIYNYLVDEWSLPHIECDRTWLFPVLLHDAVNMFEKLQYHISEVSELDWAAQRNAIKILTFLLRRGIHLSVADISSLQTNRIIRDADMTLRIKLMNSLSILISIVEDPEGGMILKLANE